MTSSAFLRTVGELIRSARSDSGLTQGELGERAGIGGKYVSEIERGTRDLPLSTLHAIVEHGLQRQIDVAFHERGRPNGRGALPDNVAEVAQLIAELPMASRTRVVMLVRGIIELTK